MASLKDALQDTQKNVSDVEVKENKNNSNDEAPKVEEPKIDSLGRSYGTGRRKVSSARVWIKRGKGSITINGKAIDKYFARPTYAMVIKQPLEAANVLGEFDIICTVKAGGLSGQAGAIRHGIARALLNFNPEFRKVLRQGGFLTRDSRVVERKKYGQKKARKRFQFSKR